MKTVEPTIGSGIYTKKDLQRIFRYKSGHKTSYLFQRYIMEKFEKSANFRFYYGEKDKFVNFQTLLHMYIFLELRQRGFKYKKIFEAYASLSKLYDTPYPFTKVMINLAGNEIIVRDDDSYFSADKKFQRYFDEIINPFISKLEYSDSQIKRYYPLGKTKSVVVDPQIQLGAPIIKGTRINVDTILSLLDSGEDPEDIANLYGLSVDQINDAIEFSIAA